MSLKGKTVLITGANRGIGRALVEEALHRGAAQVYAGIRHDLDHPDGRVVPLRLDVTDPAQIADAAGKVEHLDVLVNNAGVFRPDDLTDRAALDEHLAVNLYGPFEVTRAFLPVLAQPGGVIVNNVSLMALAPLPVTPAYSLSKAAALSLTQSLRAVLAGRGLRVQAVLSGPTDTEMVRGLDIPKAAPASVAAAILDAVGTGEDEIFPDPLSRALADRWWSGAAKELERQNAAMAS